MKFVVFLILLVLVCATNCAPQDCVSKEDFNQVLKTIQGVLRNIDELKTETNQQEKEIEELQQNEGLQFLLNDTTVEERVAILEFQMSRVFDDITQISSDVTDLNSDVTNINGDINNLADDVRDLDDDIESQLTIIAAEQVLQDERMLAIESNDQGVQECIIALQTADTALTSDVTILDGRVSGLNGTVLDLGGRVGELEGRVDILEFNVTLTDKLKINHLKNNKMDVPTESAESQSLNNVTIEERVAILEFQVDVINADVTQISDDLTLVSADVTAVSDDVSRLEDELRDLDDDLEAQLTLISGEQVLQDDRIFTLEQNEEALFGTVTDLQAADVSINNRVSTLNASLTEAEGRVNLSLTVTNDRVTAVNESLTQLDGRVDILEGEIVEVQLSGTIAFQVDLNTYTSIPEGTVVKFNVVDLNIGNGYNSGTGQFTVPSGGGGLYFFYTNFFADDAKITNFVIRVNGNSICFARADQNSGNGGDNGNPSCGAIARVTEGDAIDVLYSGESGDFPVNSDGRPYNTFTGFRIAPA